MIRPDETIGLGAALAILAIIGMVTLLIWAEERRRTHRARQVQQARKHHPSQRLSARDTLPICVIEQITHGPGYMLGAAIAHDRGLCACATADAELDEMVGGAR